MTYGIRAIVVDQGFRDAWWARISENGPQKYETLQGALIGLWWLQKNVDPAFARYEIRILTPEEENELRSA